MKLSIFAESRNITLPKLKKLCMEVLGLAPDELNEAQIAQIDTAISDTLQLLPESKLLTVSDTEKLSLSQQKIVEIVGLKALRRNAPLYLQQSKTLSTERKDEAYALAFQVEQAYYNDLANYQKQVFAESVARMEKASAALTLEGLKEYKPEANDFEDCADQQNLVELLGYFGL